MTIAFTSALLRSSLRVMALSAVLLLASCSNDTRSSLQGYAEGEFVNVAAPAAGALTQLTVKRGQKLAPGTALFTLDSTNEEASRREAAERLKGAEQRLANLKGGKRAPEVQVVTAQAEQAAASRKLSLSQLQQQEKLFAGGFISRAALDQARANHDRDIARVSEAEAQGRVATQSLGRDAEIRAATADVETARAVLAQAEWRLGQRSGRAPSSPGGALVQDTYFQEGEWVPAGRPIVSLLPVGNVKVRFFVTEQKVGSVRQGDKVSVACDGCGAAIPATISYISRQSEYTPPIIYSKDSRAKLVFMIEARPSPEDGARLRPGQPVDVTLAGAQAGDGNAPASK